MKNKHIAHLSLAIIFLVFAAACKKTKDSGATYSTSKVNQALADLRDVPQLFTVRAGADTTIFGADSTMIHFYWNSFKDSTNDTIGNVQVSIALTEVYTLKDMIANMVPSTTKNGLLQNTGAIHITAIAHYTWGLLPLYASVYGVGFKNKSASGTGAIAYTAKRNNSDSVLTWTMMDTTIPGRVAHGTYDTIHTATGGVHSWHDEPNKRRAKHYYFYDGCADFDWTGSQILYDGGSSSTTVSVVLPDNSFNPSNTGIFLVFPSINSMVMVHGKYESILNMVTLEDGVTVPTGIKYEIAVITNKDGNYYYWQTTGVTANGLKVSAVMTPTSQEDIKKKLANL